MRTFLALILAMGALTLAAQNHPKLEKMPIGKSGCSGYFPKGMPAFDMSLSEDGSEVYSSEMEANGYVFGNITVKFKAPFQKSSNSNMEDVLEAYLEFLQKQFGVTGTAGLGRGHRMEGAPHALGMIDYWEDRDGLSYSVKGWIDPNFLSVMYIYGEGDYPSFNLQEMYLNGFRFPGK